MILRLLCFSQSLIDDTIIIKSFMSFKNLHGKSVYINNSLGWDKLHNEISKNRNFKCCSNLRIENATRLSKNEQKFILEEINKNRNFAWGQELFLNSLCVPMDSAFLYLKKESDNKKGLVDSLLLSKSYLKLDSVNKYQPWIYGFSKPIYFRDHTFCVIYKVAYCCGGSVSGYENITFYRKEMEQWLECVTFYLGDF